MGRLLSASRLAVGVAMLSLMAGCASDQTPPTSSVSEPLQIDVTAGSGEPGALDTVCEISRGSEGDFLSVFVVCPADARPDEATARASLVQGYALPIAPGGARRSDPTTESRWFYEFTVDTGERPLKRPPVYPGGAAFSEVATCVARLDLNPDGSTTNVCVTCAASAEQEAFEAAARRAVDGWVFESVGDAGPDAQRSGRLEGLKFELNAGETRIAAPPPPEVLCGTPAPVNAAVDTSSVVVDAEARPTPISRTPPQYPRAAANRGIEAACTIVLDLQPDGAPVNVCARCAASEQVAAFEREAVRTVSRWRYAPQQNVVSAARSAVTTVLEFAIDGRGGPGSGLEVPPAPVCVGGVPQ